MTTEPTPHHVVAVVYDGFQPLDLSGPMEVVVGATAAGVDPPYAWRTVATTTAPVTSASGLRIVPDATIDEAGPVDTLLVVGGPGSRSGGTDPELVGAVADLAQRAGRITSVCTGALLLAAAGVLDGRTAATHWNATGLLAAYPEVTVDVDRLWVRDGPVWTSAGVTAGIDLYLAIVEADHGPEVAHLVARHLVVFVQRPGGQHQFSSFLRARPARSEPLRELQRWIPDHLDHDLTVTALAHRAGLSARTLTRRFRTEVGTSPAAFVEEARVEAARHLLERSDLTIEAIAARVGFGHGETLHRAFRRRVRTTPAQYRNHFGRNAS